MSPSWCVLGIFLLASFAVSLPVEPDEDIREEGEGTTTEVIPANETQNLFVIKSVVYEIGILTDGGDDDYSNETHEQVDVSFFNPEHNGSLIDLSNIPVPIQTNVSGVAVTGILPADLGSITLNDDGTASYNGSAFPVLPSKQVRITHNISTVDKDKTTSILSGLPKILGLDDLIKTPSKDQDKEANDEEAEGNKDDKESENSKDVEDDKGSKKEEGGVKDLKVEGLSEDNEKESS